jgi:hypothetical protein
VVVRVDRQGTEIVARETLPRIAAAESGLVKRLPRAKRGEGRRSTPPPVYRYDRLDDRGEKVTASNIAPPVGPTRRPGRVAGGRA